MRRRGNTVLEVALFVPFLVTLLVSIEELGKFTYTYYSIKKILYTAARYAGTQQAVNFCDPADLNIVNALNFATTATSDASGAPLVTGLTPDLLTITAERYDASSQILATCDCSNTGCDISLGDRGPDYIAVSIPNGYSYQLNIPFLRIDPIIMRPQVLVPYGGT
jgi:Flp pilus assembly protein TadG